MSEKIDKYLLEVESNLASLSIEEKKDILEEIQSHIEEAVFSGEKEEMVLKRLGSPKSLANAFIGESMVTKKMDMKHLLKLVSFYAKTGFSGILIVTFLGVLSVSLYGLSFMCVIIGAVLSIGTAFGIQFPGGLMNIGFWSLPNILGLPILGSFGIGLHLLSKYLRRLLQEYIAGVAKKHRLILEK